MARPTTDADSDPLAPERALEVVLDVPAAAATSLVDPARLGEWLASAARVEGDTLHLCIEEEYGYRRHVVGRVATVEPDRCVAVAVERAEREWDGSDGETVGPAMPHTRWHEPEYDDTRIELRIVDGVVLARWSGFADHALDATRRVGTLLRWSVERASDAHGSGALRRHATSVRIGAPPMVAWGALGELAAEPGSEWHDGEGGAGGRVLLAVAGRRLAASWHGPGEPDATGLLDVRIMREGGGGSVVDAQLAVVQSVDPDVAEASVAWLAGLVANSATEPVTEA